MTAVRTSLPVVFADALEAAIHDVDLAFVDVILEEMRPLLELSRLEFADAVFVRVEFLLVGV